MIEQSLIDLLKKYLASDLSRSDDFGQEGFAYSVKPLHEIMHLLRRMSTTLNRLKDPPAKLFERTRGYVSIVIKLAKEIEEYDPKTDRDRQKRDGLNDKITRFYDATFNPGQHDTFLLTLYGVIHALDAESKDLDIEEAKQELERAEAKYVNLLSKVEALQQTLQTEAGKKTATDYAKIFEEQAEKHSAWQVSRDKRRFKIKIGTAQLFFILGFIMAIALVILLSVDFLDVSNGDEWYKDLGTLAQKLLIVSLFLFGMRFCFRQYTINKHLATANRHRQNALNSINLFLATIDKKDVATRNALITEVARAIYEQRSTGYVGDKATDMSVPSILEITKLVSPGTSG